MKTKGSVRPETVLAQTDLKVDPRFLDTDAAFDLDARVAYDRGASLAIADVADMIIPKQKMAARIDLSDTRFSLFLETWWTSPVIWIWQHPDMPLT